MAIGNRLGTRLQTTRDNPVYSAAGIHCPKDSTQTQTSSNGSSSASARRRTDQLDAPRNKLSIGQTVQSARTQSEEHAGTGPDTPATATRKIFPFSKKGEEKRRIDERRKGKAD